MKNSWVGIALLLVASGVDAKAKVSKAEDVIYVYSDKGSTKDKSYAPSGWMGDYGDLKIDVGNVEDPADGRTAIKIVYDAEGRQGANWAGIYWQNPPNNWGDKPGGFDLSGSTKLTFWAKAIPGKPKNKDQEPMKVVKIAEFKMGGITGNFMDTDSANIGPIELSGDNYKKYTIPLDGKDLSKIIGGFCWAASRDDNPYGFTLYLDEIRYEK